jgi:hypothetical protein
MPGYWTQLNSGRWRNGTFNKSVESEKFFFTKNCYYLLQNGYIAGLVRFSRVVR